MKLHQCWIECCSWSNNKQSKKQNMVSTFAENRHRPKDAFIAKSENKRGLQRGFLLKEKEKPRANQSRTFRHSPFEYHSLSDPVISTKRPECVSEVVMERTAISHDASPTPPTTQKVNVLHRSIMTLSCRNTFRARRRHSLSRSCWKGSNTMANIRCRLRHLCCKTRA